MLFDSSTALNKQEWVVDETLSAFYSCWSNTKPDDGCLNISLLHFLYRIINCPCSKSHIGEGRVDARTGDHA